MESSNKVCSWQEILDFWYSDSAKKHWWSKSDDFDEEIRRKFYPTFVAATKGELFPWREHPHGRVAEIIVLDQFSRNLHRGKREAFENDLAAIILTQEAVRLNIHKELQGTPYLGHLLMPLMHSESVPVHEEAMKLFAPIPEGEGMLKYEKLHYDIIKQFGRYPHRNKVLGRENTKEEVEYLEKNPKGF
ncbi:uncharacterized protein LOC129597618 [Paramacrobiotus metropolitanus]|uniref:uncharacterized protein LOC129597618 n=1 Tax=Paramacrobiotus metropolitanus TaxID=2943436 RepID=UPI002445E530|nr:uncharacterized protein LOC129597618 [Paramacrobiotus metropolitanus]